MARIDHRLLMEAAKKLMHCGTQLVFLFKKGGTLRHDIGPEIGHRVTRVKMNYNTALITSFLDFDRPIRFIVKTVNPQCIKHSNKSYKLFEIKNKMQERAFVNDQRASYPPNLEITAEHEALDSLRERERKGADKKSGKYIKVE